MQTRWKESGEGDFMLDIANKTNPGDILEVGSDVGDGSTLILGSVAAKRNARLYCVDTFCDMIPFSTSEWRNNRTKMILGEFIKNVSADGLFDRIRILRMSSVEAELLIGDRCVFELIFIDGSHTSPYVDEDFRVWPRHVAKGGYLLAHDASTKDVVNAINEWQNKEGDLWEYVGGVGILKAWKKK